MKKIAPTSNIVWQVMAAGITMAVILFWLKPFMHDHSMWAAGAASIGSSIYLVYAQPKCLSSQPVSMLLCYLLAFVIGLLLHWLVGVLIALPPTQLSLFIHDYLYGIMGFIALIVVLLVSILLRIPHPPAAGMALILTLDIDGAHAVAALFVGVLFLTACRIVFRKKLVNLWA